MDKQLVRLAYLALAGSALTPACGSSDQKRNAAVEDAGTDATPTLDSGSAATGGRGGGVSIGGGGTGTGGAGGGGGAIVDAGSGGTLVDTGTGIPDASLDAAPDVTSPPLDTGAPVPCVADDSDATPPTLVSATLIAPDEIRLAFSEPVKSPVGVDPTQFRISIGWTFNSEGVVYSLDDPALVLAPDSGVGSSAVRSLSGACGTTLTAKLAGPLNVAALCTQLVTHANDPSNIASGLYVHARAVAASVEDRAGLPLVPRSPEWATPVDGGGLPSRISRYDSTGVGVDALAVSLTCGDAKF